MSLLQNKSKYNVLLEICMMLLSMIFVFHKSPKSYAWFHFGNASLPPGKLKKIRWKYIFIVNHFWALRWHRQKDYLRKNIIRLSNRVSDILMINTRNGKMLMSKCKAMFVSSRLLHFSFLVMLGHYSLFVIIQYAYIFAILSWCRMSNYKFHLQVFQLYMGCRGLAVRHDSPLGLYSLQTRRLTGKGIPIYT